jgi:hypothetical protein
MKKLELGMIVTILFSWINLQGQTIDLPDYRHGIMIRLKILLALFGFLAVVCVHAQNDTMYIMKSGMVVGQYPVSAIDSIIFYNPDPDTGFICGGNLIISHVAGDVAPVSKTTTYGTVDDIPGEPGKCWTTSNLGSDHQATAKNDETEASAGWYWQFNRKQGYRHDGSSALPQWTITWIEENSGWQPDADPCRLELGAPWRLPTETEWSNVDLSGGWVNGDGAWNSGLKLHAAGFIGYFDGSMNQRGATGAYWSGNQDSSWGGLHLFFDGTTCETNYYYKAMGFTVRCIR